MLTEYPDSQSSVDEILLEMEKHKIFEKIIEELSKIIGENCNGMEFRQN